jgi:predicted dienelactone hydrolase
MAWKRMRQRAGQRVAFLLAALSVLVAALGCASTARGGGPTSPTSCHAPFTIGYQMIPFHAGRGMAVWYPSGDAQATYQYAPDTASTLAYNGRPLSGCGAFPLVVFSHGLGGCGVQSLFITETLARQGYVVAAPDHADALCRVDGSGGRLTQEQEPSLFDPKAWTDTAYIDRKDDMELAIAMMTSGAWAGVTDSNHIGVAGHSLGGYTALGVVGGWSSWRDARIKVALLLSPYSLPFSVKATLSGVTAPLMYQGAEGDIGITPFLEGPNGAYARSNPPKYVLKLRGGNHFTWTNFLCGGEKTVANCVADKPDAQRINTYAIAFLNTYLKGQDEPLLTGAGTGLSAYSYQR